MAYIGSVADAYDEMIAALGRRVQAENPRVVIWAKPSLVHDALGNPGMDVPWRPKYIDVTELGDMAGPAAWSIFETFIESEHPNRAGVGGEA